MPTKRLRRPGVVTKKDGREIMRTPAQWQKRRAEIYARDGGKCTRCGRAVPLHDEYDENTGDLMRRAGEVHHQKGRGLGGSLRDDRPEALELTCYWCHREGHQAKKVVPAKERAL